MPSTTGTLAATPEKSPQSRLATVPTPRDVMIWRAECLWTT